MEFKFTLQETLEARFTDRDEMADVANYGAMSGFGGFIYTREINEFFNEFENEIENYYYEIFGDQWIKESGAADCDGFDAMRAHLVWGLIELYCSDALDNEEDECYVDSLITAGV